MKRFLLAALAVTLSIFVTQADEGMWLPNLIGQRIGDMRSKGCKLSADDIYSINRASLKDAVVLFGRGCTAELISADGLLLTNHHCGYSQIQNHSTLSHDYLTDGFWAMNRGEELPNPDLTVTFLVRMEDVTERVLAGTDLENTDRVIAAANIKAIVAEAATGDLTASVESFYSGNQYFLFVYRVFKDVRLVAAPPSSIGKFGGDTDNWIWPRHTGDFSLFRIYADSMNRPAPYRADNVPYKSPKHLVISTKGVREGDFTMIYGCPGTTRRYVTSDFVDYTLNYSNPVKIRLRTARLNVINAAQEADPQVRIMYAAKHARIANAWKKWQGESLGLARLGTIDKKRAYEKEFQRWAADKPQYSHVLEDLHQTYTEMLPYAVARDYYNEAIQAIELFTAYPTQTGAGKIDDFYKNYSPEIDRRIAKLMLADYAANSPQRFIPEEFTAAVASAGGIDAYVDSLFNRSAVANYQRCMQAVADSSIKSDPAVEMYAAFTKMYKEQISDRYTQLSRALTSLYKTYMRGIMAYEPEKQYFPDANLTLRVAYGHVCGYEEADAVYHRPQTTLDGIIAKDNPYIYDYDVPERLREVYAARDFGRWAINTGTKREPHYTVPVCFLASNHTTGGNSGSPVLNARGQLVGINFDRTWLSTMSDLEFDSQICRNIALDIRYMLFVIDKVGGAGYLIDEMDLN